MVLEEIQDDADGTLEFEMPPDMYLRLEGWEKLQ